LSVVVDANVLVVLALDRERGPVVERKLREWAERGHELHAPALLRYEVASALANAVAAGQLASDAEREAWELIVAVPVELHPLDDGPAVVAMAQQLQRRSAYDAAYVVLAQDLGTDLWTLDGPLVRNASSRGLPVKLLERETEPKEPARDDPPSK
jgi:predicted nucleic acid-binding protein